MHDAVSSSESFHPTTLDDSMKAISRRTRWLAFFSAHLLVLIGTSTVYAQPTQTLSVAGSGGNLDVGGQLGYRLHLESGTQYGLEFDVFSTREEIMGGVAIDDGTGGSITALSQFPMAAASRLRIDMRLSVLGRIVATDDAEAPGDQSTTLGFEIGPIANVLVSDRIALRTGFVAPQHIELTPDGGLARTGTLSVLGLAWRVTDTLGLYIDGRAGGLFGFGGDGLKFLASGTVGFRYTLGGRAPLRF